jgi:hypothetical protein
MKMKAMTKNQKQQQHLIKTAVEIRIHYGNFNTDGGFNLSWSCYLVTNRMQQSRGRDRIRASSSTAVPTGSSWAADGAASTSHTPFSNFGDEYGME